MFLNSGLQEDFNNAFKREKEKKKFKFYMQKDLQKRVKDARGDFDKAL